MRGEIDRIRQTDRAARIFLKGHQTPSGDRPFHGWDTKPDVSLPDYNTSKSICSRRGVYWRAACLTGQS